MGGMYQVSAGVQGCDSLTFSISMVGDRSSSTRSLATTVNTCTRLVPEHVDLSKRLTHTCTDVMVMITHERPYRQHPKRLCPADLRRTASYTHLSTTGSCMHMITPYLAFEQMPDFTNAAMIVRKSALTSFTSQAYLS